MSLPFHIVDVFAETRYGGNQLAVVADAGDLSADAMQKIALEMNFSETTFIRSDVAGDRGYPVRIFTPAQELPFAGHPTLGTASVIRHRLAADRPDLVRLDLGVGTVPVRFDARVEPETAWLSAPSIELGRTCKPDRMASALGLEAGDFDDRSPIQTASAGLSIVIVPLRSADALQRAALDRKAFTPLMVEGVPPFVYLYCSEPRSPENHLAARFFFLANAVREDPATGSATACLGRYLLEHRYRGAAIDLRIEQGHEVNRPSLLLLRARAVEGGEDIQVGGHVIATAEGSIV